VLVQDVERGVLVRFGVEAGGQVARDGVDFRAQVEDGAARFIVVQDAGGGLQRQPKASIRQARRDGDNNLGMSWLFLFRMMQ
jgi:hypothetical protein